MLDVATIMGTEAIVEVHTPAVSEGMHAMWLVWLVQGVLSTVI